MANNENGNGKLPLRPNFIGVLIGLILVAAMGLWLLLSMLGELDAIYSADTLTDAQSSVSQIYLHIIGAVPLIVAMNALTMWGSSLLNEQKADGIPAETHQHTVDTHGTIIHRLIDRNEKSAANADTLRSDLQGVLERHEQSE